MGKIINKFIEWAISKFIGYKSEAIITIAVGAIMWIIALLQSIPLFYRIPIILFVILCVLLIFRLVVWIYDNFLIKFPLVIIYDNGKYNGLEQIPRYYNGYKDFIERFAYRIAVNNSSRQTIYNVSVNMESDCFSNIPNKAIFTNTRESNCNIHPGSIEIVTLFYTDTKDIIIESGKIIITIIGENTQSIKKKFIIKTNCNPCFYEDKS